MNKAQNADEYISNLREQLAKNSECGTTHYNLGVALMGKQEYDDAEESLRNAVENSPNLAEAYVLLGGICLKRNDLEGCLRFNKLATKSRAGFAEGYANIGFVLIQLVNGSNPIEDEEKIDLAIKNLKKAIIHNSKFVQAFATLGTAYFMKGLVDEGIKANLEAIGIQPEFPIAHNNLAVAFLEKKEYQKAIEHHDIAVKLGFPVNKQLTKELEPFRK